VTARWVGQQLRLVKERDLQQTVTDLCHLLGLDCFHVRNARGMAPGWPDLVIIGSQVLYRELKTETGVLSAEQKRVGARLADAGADWAVWRPRDLRSGVIERQLRQLTPPPMLPFADLATRH
jgi:hypothetical protein